MSKYYQVQTTKMAIAINQLVQLGTWVPWYERDSVYACSALPTNPPAVYEGCGYMTKVAVPNGTRVVRTFELQDNVQPRFEIVDLRPKMEVREHNHQSDVDFLSRAWDFMYGNLEPVGETTREVASMESYDESRTVHVVYVLHSVPDHLGQALVDDLEEAVNDGLIPVADAYSVDSWPSETGEAIVAYTPIANEHVASWVEHHRYRKVLTFRC